MFQIVPLKLVKILIINMIAFFGVPRTKVEHPEKDALLCFFRFAN